MRTCLSLATFVALGLAISLLSAPLNAQQPPSGTNVAVVDLGQIFKNHERFKRGQEELRQEAQKLEEYVRNQQQRLVSEQEKLRGFREGTRDYQLTEEGIATLRAEADLHVRRKRKELEDREARLLYHTYMEVVQRVEAFASRANIGLVLQTTTEPINPDDPRSITMGINRSVLYQRNLDITHDILAELNRGTPPTNLGTRPQIPGSPGQR